MYLCMCDNHEGYMILALSHSVRLWLCDIVVFNWIMVMERLIDDGSQEDMHFTNIVCWSDAMVFIFNQIILDMKRQCAFCGELDKLLSFNNKNDKMYKNKDEIHKKNMTQKNQPIYSIVVKLWYYGFISLC